MRAFSPLALISILCSCAAIACAQEATVVQVGVPVMRSGVNTVSVTEARDRLVKALNQQKPDKLSHLSVRAVALDAAPGPLALAEANKKHCLFVLTAHLTNLATTTELAQYDRIASPPVYHATVEYLINRVVDGSGFALGSVETEDSSSFRDATWRALSQLAGKAVADFRRGGNSSDSVLQAANERRQAVPPPIEVLQVGSDSCAWLPKDTPHAAALRGACQYAISLSGKLPNLICEESASRYRGNNRVATDLITASLRYEYGSETYSAIKVNGKPAPDAIGQTPGLWSTGEFASNNLRSIFDPGNRAQFEFVRDGDLDQRPVWIFTYQIAKQNDPLWRLHQGNQSVAPPYAGEVWIDQQTGAVLRFRSTANDIPDTFPMAGAEEQLGYRTVAFEDGSTLVLPTDFTVSTTYRGDVATRNVVQLTNCHKFRAKARMVLNVAAIASESNSVRASSDVPSQLSLEQNNQIYSILREQAVRDDDARLEVEQRLELIESTEAAFSKLSSLDKQRQEMIARNIVTPSPVNPKGEMTTLKVKVNLVPVSVVLRDSRGRAVGNLRREDFHLFDDRKPQVITSFVVEQSGTRTGEAASGPRTKDIGNSDTAAATESDVAYVFDDIHGASDLANAKVAALKHIAGLKNGDRAAIVSTSGEVHLDFTTDHDALVSAIKSLRPYPITLSSDCPSLSHYMADLMVNQRDTDANNLAVADTMACAGLGNSPMVRELAQRLATAKAIEVLYIGSRDSCQALNVLRDVIRRTASMPGKRSIVLASPGFLTLDPDAQRGVTELIDQAIRSDIVINALDMRGLYLAGMDPSRGATADPATRLRFDSAEAGIKSDVMADLAYGTGGTFFEHNNDLDEGFRRTADAPEYVYVLGFSPQKQDGKFHKLKVTLSSPEKLTVQSRLGYYAPKADSPN